MAVIGAAITHAAALYLVVSNPTLVLMPVLLWLASLVLVVVAAWGVRVTRSNGDTRVVERPRGGPSIDQLNASPTEPSPARDRRWTFAGRGARPAPLSLWLGVLVVAAGQAALTYAEVNGTSSRAGAVGLLLGGGLFGVGARASVGRVCFGGLPSVDLRWLRDRPRPGLAAAFTAAILQVVLLTRLATGSTSGWDLVPWLLSLALFAALFVGRVDRPGVAAIRGRWGEVVLLAGLMVGFVALNMHDARHWYYAVIGDEYAFYQAARDILDRGVSRPFSQAGVYNTHPVMSSIYQAVVMAAFGQDHEAWKLAQALSIAAGIPGMYLLGSALASRPIGAIAAGLFAASHYLFAYAHTGYNNIHALNPAIWSFALLVAGLQRRSPLLLYGSGVAAGLGFYTFFSARAILPIIGLYVLTQRPGWRRIAGLWPLTLGAVAAAGPIAVASGTELWTRMMAQVPGGYSSDITGPIAQRVWSNVIRNGLAFNFNQDGSHFVTGSLLDPVSAALAVLGIGLAIRFIRHEGFRLPLLWFVVALAVTGFLSPYPNVAISRLHFCLPPLILLAAMAAGTIGCATVAHLRAPTTGWARLAAPVGLIAVMVVLNVHRFWLVSPSRVHLSQESLTIGALKSPTCGDDTERTVIVARTPSVALAPALVSLDPRRELPRLVDDTDLARSPISIPASTRCVIFAFPNEEPERSALQDLSRRFPQARQVTFTDWAEKGRITILVF